MVARLLISISVALVLVPACHAGDWPQFMRSGEHSGDAPDEELKLPLGLLAQVKLDDAVLTSPAIVAGRAYVVDQMGVAYCIDPDKAAAGADPLVWKQAFDADRPGATTTQPMGSNTSSPAVVNGRVCFGTTGGDFHILDAATGRIVKTIRFGCPIISSPTIAAGPGGKVARVYVQGLDAVVRCLDLDGNELWRWDHYKQYVEPEEARKQAQPARGHPGSYEKPHYGGGEIAVAGSRVVTSIGWDLLALDDKGGRAELAWCDRAPCGRDGGIPMSSCISGESIFTAVMGTDGVLAMIRTNLNDGTRTKNDRREYAAFPWNSPAARGQMVIIRSNADLKDGIVACQWTPAAGAASRGLWQDPQSATVVLSSHALAKGHCLATTLGGELLAMDLANPKANPPYRFVTPNGKGIGSSPAVSGGRVYFGCDDGYLYVLSPEGKQAPTRDEKLTVSDSRSRPISPTGKLLDWPRTCGDPGNTCFADDANLRPPLRLRWAARYFGHGKTTCVAGGGDLFSITLDRTVTCQEQQTGRLRWRRRVPPQSMGWTNSSGLLIADGRLYVPCPNDRMAGKLLCLDKRTGQTLWSADIGKRGVWGRGSPLLVAGKVIFGHTVPFSESGAKAGSTTQPEPPVPLVQAWDAATGAPAWKVALNISGNRAASPDGCAAGDVVVFTAGNEAWQWKSDAGRKRGEAVAIDARTGDVLWRSNEVFGSTGPVLIGDKLLLNEYQGRLRCVQASDGKVVWENRSAAGQLMFTVGADLIVCRGYGGGAMCLTLADGKPFSFDKKFVKGGQLGGDDHSCGAVVLTRSLSLAITVSGLNVRDLRTGALLWKSPGFAPRGCVNPTVANSRVFFPTASSGVVYCWEND